VIINGLLLPAIFYFYFRVVVIYIRNNYFFIEDTDGINRNIVAHN